MRFLIIAAVLAGVAALGTGAQADACTDPANPGWAVSHQNPTMRAICDQEIQRNQLAMAARSQWEAEQRARIQAQADAVASQKAALAKAVGHGYQIASITDLVLDGKVLAGQRAKVQTVGVYKKVAGDERLYATAGDAYQGTSKFIPIMTEDAQRPLRAKLISYICSNTPTGCEIIVGGHMQMCRYLNALLAHYPPMSCLHIEVEIQ